MTTPTAEQILELEDRRFAAQVAADGAALEELLSDDLRYTHSNAVVDTKASYIESITSGRVNYKSADRTDTEVHPTDGAAVVVGHAELDVDTPNGARVITCRYTAVWAEVGGAWRFVAWQSTPIPS